MGQDQLLEGAEKGDQQPGDGRTDDQPENPRLDVEPGFGAEPPGDPGRDADQQQRGQRDRFIFEHGRALLAQRYPGDLADDQPIGEHDSDQQQRRAAIMKAEPTEGQARSKQIGNSGQDWSSGLRPIASKQA